MSANSAATISPSKSAPTPSSTRTLFHLEEQRSRHLRLAMALDGHRSHATLLMRIARILGEPMTRIPSRRLRPFSLAAACAGLVVLAPSRAAPAGQPQPQTAVSSRAGHRCRSGNRRSCYRAHNCPVIATEVAIHTAKPSPAPTGLFDARAPTPAPDPQSDDKASPIRAKPHSDYIDHMKAAGYDVDLDKLIAMKIQDVTPEYARAMSKVGFGKLSADDLIACKIQGVTPEYIAEMKKQGLEINNIQDAISFRIFQVTPEFVSGMKAAGFDSLTSKQLLAMRVQGVTPEYARTLKQKFPGITADELVQARIFNIDDAFIAQAQARLHQSALQEARPAAHLRPAR